MHRREFLATSTLGLATLAMGKEKTAMLPIIDTHQHLWDLKKFKLNWLKKPDHPLGKSHLPEDYAKVIEGLNFTQSVYMEVDVHVDQQQEEVDYLLELIKSKKHITVAAVVSGRPASEGFAKYVAQFKGSPYIKGIRQVIHEDDNPKGFCVTKEFISGVKLLGDLGLSFDICIRPGELTDADQLIGECPNTRFILDHLGNAPLFDAKKFETWKKDIAKLAERKNVVCKISGIVAQCKKGEWGPETLAPAINHGIEVFGWDRVMFGSDWPVCTLGATMAEWVNALKTIVKDRTEEQQKKLFHDNAKKFYGI